MARSFAWFAVFLLGLTSSFASGGSHSALAATSERPSRVDAARPVADVFALAQRYEHGEGVSQSYERALALYCEAAHRGETKAFLNLGWMFLYGRGVPRDDSIAVAWLRKAAERGTPQAVNLLRLMPNVSAAPRSGCPAMAGEALQSVAAPAEIRDLVMGTAQEIGISPQLLMAVIAVESAFNPRAVSPKNARGLMQLMPETALRFGVRDTFDEKENVRGGATYLRELLKRFDGDLVLALAAYNAGEGAIATNGGVPPYQETKDYIARVTRICACSGNEF